MVPNLVKAPPFYLAVKVFTANAYSRAFTLPKNLFYKIFLGDPIKNSAHGKRTHSVVIKTPKHVIKKEE